MSIWNFKIKDNSYSRNVSGGSSHEYANNIVRKNKPFKCSVENVEVKIDGRSSIPMTKEEAKRLLEKQGKSHRIEIFPKQID